MVEEAEAEVNLNGRRQSLTIENDPFLIGNLLLDLVAFW